MNEERNRQMAQMKINGHILQSIGDEFGITKQGADLILKKHYPGIASRLLTEAAVAELIGSSPCTLQVRRKEGTVNPIRMGDFWRYDRTEIEKAYLAIQKACAMCGKAIGGNRRYCLECSLERRRNRYRYLSPQAKINHLAAVANWQKAHPEQVKALNKKARAKYQKKLKELKQNLTIATRHDIVIV